MLTVSEDEQDLATALRNGASGYLLKTMEGERWHSAIHRTMRGEQRGGRRNDGQAGVGLPTCCGDASPSAGAGADPGPPFIPAAGGNAFHRANSTSCGASPAATATRRSRAICRIAETTVKIHVQHILRKLDVAFARAGRRHGRGAR
jgi:two-component system nitrate/nitrite response regulator NarL